MWVVVFTTLASLRVCTGKACAQQGAATTLASMRNLASVAHTTQPPPHTTHGNLQQRAATQLANADALVTRCGCLGRCGAGPNVANEQGGIFVDCFKPARLVALLEDQEGVEVPPEAARALLKSRYAERALRQGSLDTAFSLLTQALNEAGALRGDSAAFLSSLLSLRADVSSERGDEEASRQDMERACAMNVLMCPLAN